MTAAQERLFALVCEELRIIVAVIRRSGVERANADDARQHALIAAWRLIAEGRLVVAEGRDERAAVRLWVRHVAHYSARRSLRRSDHEPLDVEHVVSADPVLRLEARERLRIVGYRLSTSERALLDAVGRRETMVEIASRTRTPVGTVSTRLRKLRAVLRKQVPR